MKEWAAYLNRAEKKHSSGFNLFFTVLDSPARYVVDPMTIFNLLTNLFMQF